MSDEYSAEIGLLVPREQAENAFSDALRLYVGRGRRYSVEQLCKGIGLFKNGKPHTKPIYDFLSYPSGHPDHRPLHFGLICSITRFLGASFTCEWMRPTGQVAVDGHSLDLDDLAACSSEFALAYARARHPESEAGINIGPQETDELTFKAACLRAVR